MSNNKARRVFLPVNLHDVRFNTKPAEKYGVRVFLTDETVCHVDGEDESELTYRETTNVFDVDHVFHTFERKLNEYNFDPERDYIAMTGKPPLVAFLVATVYSMYEDWNLLMFDAATGNYRLKHINSREWETKR